MWLSGLSFAKDLAKIKETNIISVISAANLGVTFPEGISHTKFELKDNEEQEIRNVFYPVIRLV